MTTIEDVTNNTDFMNFQASISVVGTPIKIESCRLPFALCALRYFVTLEGQSPGNYDQGMKTELCRMFTMAWGINNSSRPNGATEFHTVNTACINAFNARYPDA